MSAFFSALFDFSFSKYLTRTVIGWVYGVVLLEIALVYLVLTVLAFTWNSSLGVIFLLIIGPILSFFYLVFVRVSLEVTAVLFGIYENTSAMVGAPPPAGAHLPMPPSAAPAMPPVQS